jgi:hypothetical protein
MSFYCGTQACRAPTYDKDITRATRHFAVIVITCHLMFSLFS